LDIEVVNSYSTSNEIFFALASTRLIKSFRIEQINHLGINALIFSSLDTIFSEFIYHLNKSTKSPQTIKFASGKAN
jgi:hypothetical protein